MPHHRKLGPALLVTAAFIGPGTVTTATKAGAGYGFALLWTIVFSVAATIVLQEMAARLGLVTRLGLGEAVRTSLAAPWQRVGAAIVIVAAIGFGNAAYQTGNVTGAALGLEALTGWSLEWWSVAVGAAACVFLATGVYRWIEKGLIALVAVMSLVFLVAAALTRPDLGAVLSGALAPSVPNGALTTVIALVGTTIVPYNLFLHASSVRESWPADAPLGEALRACRIDTLFAVSIGGLITAAILTTSAAARFGADGTVTAADMAQQLAPALGGATARVMFAVGLLAAGLTSAVTAPLAAAYAVCGALGWSAEMRSRRFRAIWLAVLIVGTALAATLGRSPTQTIVLAQAANGLLLPLAALFLIWAVNRRSLMGARANGPLANLLGSAVVAVVTALAVWRLWSLG